MLFRSHPDRGYTKPGGPMTEEGKRNLALFEERHARMLELMPQDGLSNLDFKLLRKGPIALRGATVPNAFHYLVDIGEPAA